MASLLPRGQTIRMTNEPALPQGGQNQIQLPPVDFDKVINRRRTGSLKFDSAPRRGYPEEVLPLWVADMDFPAAPPILEAMQERLVHGIFGYTEPWDAYYESIVGWWRDNHAYALQKEWILESPGVVFSISLAIKAFTKPGDGVLIQAPVYHPFFSVIEQNNRKLVVNPLKYEGRDYLMDFEDFQDKVEKENVKLFILCSPHNPVGRVWSPRELQRIGNICQKNGVVVVSDEIHCDITAPGFRHCVFAGMSPSCQDIAVTLTAPTKTFNLSGVQISHAFIANEQLRAAWLAEKKASGYDEPNAFGLVACQAAYEKGRPWLDRLQRYINDNENYVNEYLKSYIHGVYPVQRQGTYLLWLDCWASGYSSKEFNQRLIERGRVWLYDGIAFGAEGEGFQRLNLACPRETLAEAMTRMSALYAR